MPYKDKEKQSLYNKNRPKRPKPTDAQRLRRREKQREQYLINKEKINEKKKKWRKDNPEKAKKAYDKYVKNNIEKIKNRNQKWWLKHVYNLSLEDYDKLLESQNGLCAICRKPEIRKLKGVITRLIVDHCHKTGIIRGLLCHKCNAMLGLSDDSIETLASAIKYLTKQ